MDFDFDDTHLKNVYFDPKETIGHGAVVDKAYRKVIGKIRAALDERDLRALKGLHYHKLSGNRSHQHSLDLTNQWRLIIERIEEKGRIILMIVTVEDYH